MKLTTTISCQICVNVGNSIFRRCFLDVYMKIMWLLGEVDSWEEDVNTKPKLGLCLLDFIQICFTFLAISMTHVNVIIFFDVSAF